jgi:hypothetical protein
MSAARVWRSGSARRARDLLSDRPLRTSSLGVLKDHPSIDTHTRCPLPAAGRRANASPLAFGRCLPRPRLVPPLPFLLASTAFSIWVPQVCFALQPILGFTTFRMGSRVHAAVASSASRRCWRSARPVPDIISTVHNPFATPSPGKPGFSTAGERHTGSRRPHQVVVHATALSLHLLTQVRFAESEDPASRRPGGVGAWRICSRSSRVLSL